MRIIILSLLLLAPLQAQAQETTTELNASFNTADQAAIDFAVCLKSGQRCRGETVSMCYIDGEPIEGDLCDVGEEVAAEPQGVISTQP